MAWTFSSALAHFHAPSSFFFSSFDYFVRGEQRPVITEALQSLPYRTKHVGRIVAYPAVEDGAAVDAARRQRVEREPALSHPRAGRSVHRSARGRAGVSVDAGTHRRRRRGGARDDPPAGAAAAGTPEPGARRRRDGARASRGRVPHNGRDRRGLGAGAGGAGLARGGAGATARRGARHGDRDLARAAAGAPGRVRPARQRVGVPERSGGGGASVPVRLASALRAGAPAAAGDGRVALELKRAWRRDARVGVRAAGIPGAVGGDDAAARNKLADWPWGVGPARSLARASDRLWTARARVYGLDGAAGRRVGWPRGEDRPPPGLG